MKEILVMGRRGCRMAGIVDMGMILYLVCLGWVGVIFKFKDWYL